MFMYLLYIYKKLIIFSIKVDTVKGTLMQIWKFVYIFKFI